MFALPNGKVVFLGEDTSGLTQLWITDGTAAGTSQISSIAKYGLNPQNFVSLGNGKVLFEGYHSVNSSAAQLWVTDGTTAGTVKVSSVDANTMSIVTGLGSVAQLTNSETFVSVGNGKAFFAGSSPTDKTDTTQLWITNGTAAGTVQLTNITKGLTLSNFVTLANGKTMFTGQTSSRRKRPIMGYRWHCSRHNPDYKYCELYRFGFRIRQFYIFGERGILI